MANCSDLPDIYDKLYRLGIDADKLRVFVQGSESESVLLGTIDTPTLRKLVADIRKAGNDTAASIEQRGSNAVANLVSESNAAITEITARSNEEIDALTVRVSYEIGRITAEGDTAIENIVREGDGAVALATAQAQIAVTAADRSCECAQTAVDAADTAVNAANNIHGFANATQAFHGLYVDENMKLVWGKGEYGDTVNADSFRYSIVLPTEARFYLDGGTLAIELPFTQ